MRLVELALAGVDAELAEQALHAEGARFVGDDGHDALAELGMFEQQGQHADEAPWCSRPRVPAEPSSDSFRTSSGGATIWLFGVLRTGM